MKADVTAEYLRELLDYDPETGVFTYRRRVGNRFGIAGCQGKWGYWQIKINYSLYKAHRLAWLHVHGEWPKQKIDHINGIKTDNRIVNLRDVSDCVNAQNLQRPRRNKKNPAPLGAFWHPSTGTWTSYRVMNGKRTYLGRFQTPEEAHHAYVIFGDAKFVQLEVREQ
jgi:hypothetical protein